MRPILAALAAALVTVLVQFHAPAQADTDGCVSRGEYGNVHVGMTKTRVARIFDTGGRRADWGRAYPICKRFAGLPHRRWVFITYDGGEVYEKEWGVTTW